METSVFGPRLMQGQDNAYAHLRRGDAIFDVKRVCSCLFKPSQNKRHAGLEVLQANGNIKASDIPNHLRFGFRIGPPFLQLHDHLIRLLHPSGQGYYSCGPRSTIEPIPLAAARRFVLELAFPLPKTNVSSKWHFASLGWLCGPLQRFPQILRASLAAPRLIPLVCDSRGSCRFKNLASHNTRDLYRK